MKVYLHCCIVLLLGTVMAQTQPPLTVSDCAEDEILLEFEVLRQRWWYPENIINPVLTYTVISAVSGETLASGSQIGKDFANFPPDDPDCRDCWRYIRISESHCIKKVDECSMFEISVPEDSYAYVGIVDQIYFETIDYTVKIDGVVYAQAMVHFRGPGINGTNALLREKQFVGNCSKETVCGDGESYFELQVRPGPEGFKTDGPLWHIEDRYRTYLFESIWRTFYSNGDLWDNADLIGGVDYRHSQCFPSGHDELTFFLDAEIADGDWFQVVVDGVDWGQGTKCTFLGFGTKAWRDNNMVDKTRCYSGRYVPLYVVDSSSTGSPDPVTIMFSCVAGVLFVILLGVYLDRRKVQNNRPPGRSTAVGPATPTPTIGGAEQRAQNQGANPIRIEGMQRKNTLADADDISLGGGSSSVVAEQLISKTL
jgi:hypothetical protein